MDALIQKLHPALLLGQQVMVAKSGAQLFSRQGDWDSGNTLHCAAMALALLGRLSNPAGAEPELAGFNARLEFGKGKRPTYVTTTAM